MNAEDQVKIIQAYMAGSPIERYDNADDVWIRLSRRSGHTGDHKFDFAAHEYRIVAKRKITAVLWDNHYDRPASLQPTIDDALEEAARLNKQISAENGKACKRYSAVVMTDGKPE